MVGTLGMYALHGWGNKASLLTIIFMSHILIAIFSQKYVNLTNRNVHEIRNIDSNKDS